MEPSVLFKITNTIALLGWIIMLVLHHRPLMYQLVFGGIITLLSICYAAVIVWSFSEPAGGGDFSSLEGVMTLFTKPKAVLAGWIHYLAFDMTVGLLIVYHSVKLGIKRWIIIPCQFFTFMFGPVGLLLYVVGVTVYKRSFPVNIFQA